jgi:hypothetical protein
MKTLRKRSFKLLLVLLMSLSIVPTPAHQARKSNVPFQERSWDDQQSAAIVEKLLGMSGYKYTSTGAGVWIIRRPGQNIKSFQLVLSTGGGTLFTEVIVARGKSFRVNEAAPNILRVANKLSYVKVGLDKDDDLFVRNEARLKSLDVDEFKTNIERVSAAADMVYAEVQPFRGF